MSAPNDTAPPGGTRLHPRSIVVASLEPLKELLASAAAAVLGVWKLGDRTPDATLGLAIGVAAVAGAIGFGWLRWRATRWWLHADGIEVHGGVLLRERQRVPYARLQGVELRQPAVHRLLGLAELRGDTAAGDEQGEIRLDGLTMADATALRDRLLAERAAAQARLTGMATAQAAAGAASSDVARAGSADPELLLALSNRRLALAGMTRLEGGAAVLALLALLERLSGVDALRAAVRAMLPARAPEALGRGEAGAVLVAGLAVAAVLAALVVAGWALAIGRMLLRWRGYRLTRRAGVLEVSHGALDRAARLVALDRVEAVRLIEGPGARLAGLVEVRADLTGSSIDARLEEFFEGKGGPLVPCASRAEVPRLLDTLLPGQPLADVPLARAHPLARVRLAVLLGAPWLGALAALPLVPDRWRAGWAAGSAALLAIALLAAHLGWRQRGWAAVGPVLVARHGVFGRATVLARRERLRTVAVRAGPLQRRLGLLTLELSTAAHGAVVVARDLTPADAARLCAMAGVPLPDTAPFGEPTAAADAWAPA